MLMKSGCFNMNKLDPSELDKELDLISKHIYLTKDIDINLDKVSEQISEEREDLDYFLHCFPQLFMLAAMLEEYFLKD